MTKYCLLLIINFFITLPLLYANEVITPDSIKVLRNQGKLKEAKLLANSWLKNTENKYGDDAIEVVIPLLVSSELSIIHYEYRMAIKQLGRSIEIMDKSSGWLYPDYALALNYLAYCKINIGDSFAAFPLIDEAEMIYFKTLSPKHPDFNLCTINRAILNLHLGEFKKSEKYFQKSFRFIEENKEVLISNKSKSIITIEWLNIQLAKLYIKWYKPQKALDLLSETQGKLIAQNKNASPIYSILLESLADLYFSNNEYKIAYTFHEELTKHRTKYFGKEHLATMMAYLDLGKLMSEKGFLDKALENFTIVEKYVTKLKGHNNLKADLNINISDIYVKRGNVKKASQYLSYISVNKITKRDLYFYLLRVQGDLLFLEGDYINAELKLMELVSIVRQERVFFTKHYSEAIVTLAELYVTLGRLQNAIDLCDTEVEFLSKRGMENSVVFHNLRLTDINAQLIESMIDKTETLKHIANIEDSLMLYINSNHPLFIKSNTLKGKIASKNENYEAAISFFHKAIEIANKHSIDEMQYQRLKIIDLVGGIYIKKGELQKALNEFRVLKGKYTEQSVYWPGFLGRVAYVKALLGEWEEAKNLIIKGVDVRINQYDTQLTFTSEDEKINYIHHTSGIFNYFFSMMTFNEGYKSPIMVEKCYDLQLNYRKYFLMEAIARKRKIEKLGEYRRQMNFTNYLLSLDQQKSQLATANFFSIKERNDLGIDTYMLTDRINNLEKSLSFASRSNIDSLSITNYISWKDVQGKLEENEVAVEVIKLKSIDPRNAFYVAIAISSDCKSPKFIPIGNASLMENDLFRIYSRETKPKVRSLVYRKSSTPKVNSYDHYWKPIQDGINELTEHVDKIYLSKDGIYNAVNLNILFNKETKKYLIEENDIDLVISTSEIDHKNELINFKNNEICLFGNPTFEGNLDEFSTRNIDERGTDKEKYRFYLDNLPGTKMELDNTANLFESKGWNVNSFFQDQATEYNIKNLSSSPAIMHIATHGVYIDELINPILQNPLLKSGLFFTEIAKNKEKPIEDIYASGNDGLLTAYEVKGLNLENTSLLVLSACQSGVSDIADGDGISGLQYAFSIAGVESIIMSLWSVDDVATQKLMNEFYKQWFDTKDIDKAFRNAQLKLMKEYKDPYYWGAFVLVH